jgi:glyoxylase-like metal-dependent hydrolase (beta-lactamase superfamily II)
MIRLLGELWAAAGLDLTHPWDGSAYLIKGDEPTLIDCGSLAGYPALKRSLQSFGYEPRDIKRVIATHGHWDHVSGMALLREESDARLYLHEGDRAAVESGDRDLTAAFLYDMPFPTLTVDGRLNDGEILHINGVDLTVIHTPGHSPGSVCFWADIGGVKILIAGDTIWGGYHPRLGSDLDAWARSIDRILELDFDVMTFGHYRPALIFNAKHRVKELRRRFGDLFNPWFELVNAG